MLGEAEWPGHESKGVVGVSGWASGVAPEAISIASRLTWRWYLVKISVDDGRPRSRIPKSTLIWEIAVKLAQPFSSTGARLRTTHCAPSSGEAKMYVLYGDGDVGSDITSLYHFVPKPGNPQKVVPTPSTPIWHEGRWSWEQSTNFFMADPLNNGKPSPCILYNYIGQNHTTLFQLLPKAGDPFLYERHMAWDIPRDIWDLNSTRIVISPPGPDFFHLYCYPEERGLFVTRPGGASPLPLWKTVGSPWWWKNASRFFMADVSDQGKLEFCFLSFDSSETYLYVVQDDPNNPKLLWRSGNIGEFRPGNLKLQLTIADARGKGKKELCMFIDCTNNESQLWVFPAGGSQPIKQWGSGTGNFAWNQSRCFSAEIPGFANPAFCVLYNYDANQGLADTGLWIYPFGNEPNWQSGPHNWEWKRSRVPSSENIGTRTSL